MVYGITAHTEAVGGIGNIAVNLYNNVTVNGVECAGSYGINASSVDKGNISVITNPGVNINSGSNGINAVNLAPSIDASYDSSIVVTAATERYIRGSALTGTGNPPAGISAGYLGPAPGGVVTTTYPLTAIHGDVVVNNFSNINADSGDGIRAFDLRDRRCHRERFRRNDHDADVGSPTHGLGTESQPPTTAPATYASATSAGIVINAAGSGIVAINRAP